MQVNRISNINFRETNNVRRKADSQNAILMLRDANASVKFQKNQEFAKNADSVDTNPLKALGYKLYRTFCVVGNNDQAQQTETKQINTLA